MNSDDLIFATLADVDANPMTPARRDHQRTAGPIATTGGPVQDVTFALPTTPMLRPFTAGGPSDGGEPGPMPPHPPPPTKRVLRPAVPVGAGVLYDALPQRA